MCSQNLPLKLICLTCFFIMIVDGVVLYQTIMQLEVIQNKVYYEVFTDCYKPQIMMRIIFTCYAINAAALCFILTLALCYLSEDRIEWVAMKLFTYTYILFGPVMMICCLYGFIFIKGLLFQCQPSYITSNVNFMDVFILVGCTVFSSIITLFYSMHHTVEKAQEMLRDEKSIMYRLFLDYLGYRRRLNQEAQRRQQLESRRQSEASNSQPRSYNSLDQQYQNQIVVASGPVGQYLEMSDDENSRNNEEPIIQEETSQRDTGITTSAKH